MKEHKDDCDLDFDYEPFPLTTMSMQSGKTTKTAASLKLAYTSAAAAVFILTMTVMVMMPGSILRQNISNPTEGSMSVQRRLMGLDPKTVEFKSTMADYSTADTPDSMNVMVDPGNDSSPANTNYSGKNRRKFVSYQSSAWELSWLKRVDDCASKKQICQILIHDHSSFVHDFLNLTCTSRYEAPYSNWCVIDDDYHPLWYNTANRDQFEISWMSPLPYDAIIGPPQPVVPGPQHENVASKFVFLDEETGQEYVEYIEPLVSHLRFPLSQCIDNYPNEEQFKYHMIGFRGFIIPPPPVVHKNRALYFDAGGAQWGHGPGGPQLQYFHNVWKRHGVDFDEMYAYQIHTPVAKFMEGVPEDLRDRVEVHKVDLAVTGDADGPEHPFLPNEIKRKASPGDYVLCKLDVDNSQIEGGTVLALLKDEDPMVSELAWEHHIRGNYLMREWGHPDELPDVSLRESYELFLLLRQKGIRAHSWI